MPFIPYLVGGIVVGLILGAIAAAALTRKKQQTQEAEVRKEAEVMKERIVGDARSEAAKMKAEAAEEQLR